MAHFAAEDAPAAPPRWCRAGVNLGGWLLCERWMQEGLFAAAPGATDEHALASALGPARAAAPGASPERDHRFSITRSVGDELFVDSSLTPVMAHGVPMKRRPPPTAPISNLRLRDVGRPRACDVVGA